MPNENKDHLGENLGDSRYCSDYCHDKVFDSFDDEPIFSDGIPILTEKLSAIELQILQSTNVKSANIYNTQNTKKGLLGGFWLRKKNKELV